MADSVRSDSGLVIGQEVYYGPEGLHAVVDGLTRTFAALIVDGLGLGIADYGDIQVEG